MKDHIELDGQVLALGQTVYLEPRGNFARMGRKDIRPATIKSFGNRYIHLTLDDSAQMTAKVDMKTRRSVEDGDCNSYYQLWFSMEEYEHAVERKRREKAVTQFFWNWNNSRRLSESAVWAIYDLLKKEGVLSEEK